MTASISAIATVLAAGAVALGGAFDGGSDGSTEGRRQALVIDAGLARDGRDLLDPRLRDAGVELRVPRDAEEARMNVRYFAESGADLVVAGPDSAAAAEAVHASARQRDDAGSALGALVR
jgi:hypothetical protein